MAAIDVGNAATNRATYVGANITYADDVNPANLSGTIDTIELWPQIQLTNCKVGLIYNTGGNDYKCRSVTTLGTVASGAKRTYSGLNLAVEAGDILAIFFDGGRLESDSSGGNRIYKAGDQLTVNNEQTYTVSGNSTNSLYGSGETPAAGGAGGPAGLLVAQGII